MVRLQSLESILKLTSTEPSFNKAEDKAIFFDELYALGQDTEDEVNSDGMHSFPVNRDVQDSSFVAFEPLSAQQAPENNDRIPSVRRTASQPLPTFQNANSANIDNPLQSLHNKVLARSHSTLSAAADSVPQTSDNGEFHERRAPRRTSSAPSSSAVHATAAMEKSSLGKRKRKEAPLKYLPQAQQIFLGYNFFFIPNDDVAPMRRARIRKAQEYGARWISVWGNEITHIVVDKSLSYQDIITFLKIPSIPTDMIMVNDTYLVDCVLFKAILEPDQKLYRVKGHGRSTGEKPQQKSPSQIVNTARPLNPTFPKPRKGDFIPLRTTPPRSESSTQPSLNGPTMQIQSEEILVNAGMERSSIDPHREIRQDEPKPTDQGSRSQSIKTPKEEARDALDEIIIEAHKTSYLPLDEDDSDRPSSRDESPERDGTSGENFSDSCLKSHNSVTKISEGNTFDQRNFSCMKGGTGTTDISNPNSRTITILQEMADYYTRINDIWRPIAYRKAISTLRQQSNKISTSEEALLLPCIGKRLALKIEEIVTTDRLRRLENARTEPGDTILQLFMGIYGVGLNQANKWLHCGYNTLDDLKAHAKLTDNQLLGIEHYEDFQTCIPRQEVTALGNIVKAAANAIDSGVEIIIGGSYRRGAATSGDIDCIVTKPNTKSSQDIFEFLQKLISKLTLSKFLVAALAVPRTESGTKWHGCCILPGTAKPVWRRIDFLLVPGNEIGAALIYFTGNDIFNRSIRLLASRKGMRLNQRGLYKHVMRGPGRVKLNNGELVEGADEKKVFEALGVPWRPPEQRVC